MDATGTAASTPDARRAPSPLRVHRGNLRTLLLAAACVVGRPTPVSTAVGWALIVAGSALHLWARGCLRINREVTTSGPYRWTRNPFYVANFLVDAAVCVVAASPWLAAAALPVWLVVYRRQVRREEAFLLATFGDRWAAYRARVPRFLPWKGPVRGLEPSAGFSWRNQSVATGKEAARLVRFLGAPLLLFAVPTLLFARGPGDEAARRLAWNALALLGSLEAVSWALVRRVRHDRPAAPFALRSPLALGVALAALAGAAWSVPGQPPAAGPRALLLGAAWGIPLLVAAATTAAAGSRRVAVAIRWAAGLAVLALGMATSKPWLGFAGVAWFGVLAVDRMDRLPDDRTV